MKHVVWALVFGVLACNAKPADPVPAEPKVVPTVERDLLAAVCALTLTPASHSSGASGAAVIQTADKQRHPWIIRNYQHKKLEDLEKELWLPNADDHKLTSSMFPTSFCAHTGPIYATIRLYNPDDKQTWVLAGKLGALTKEAIPGDRLDEASRKRGMELVFEALKKDGRAKPSLVEHAVDASTRTTGLTGEWTTAFNEIAKAF